MTGPAVLRFDSTISRPPEAKNDSGAVLDLPKAIATKLRDVPKVEGTIEGHPFRAALEPSPDGGVWLRVNKAMLRGPPRTRATPCSSPSWGRNPIRSPPPISAPPSAKHPRPSRCGTN